MPRFLHFVHCIGDLTDHRPEWPKHSAEVLPSIPKCKRAVMCPVGKGKCALCVLKKEVSFRHELYVVDPVFNVNEATTCIK